MSARIDVGQPAPDLRLPAAQGNEIGLADFRGKQNVIVWFTKGMACPFCRQHMTQLARGYPCFRELGAEILEVTVSPLSRAKFYARKFSLPFPYLCDPDYLAHRAWGLEDRSHSPGDYVRAFFQGARRPKVEPNEFGSSTPDFLQMHRVLFDDELGFFIVDRDGIVRYALSGSYMDPNPDAGARPIPTNEEIEQQLNRLNGA